MKHLHIFLVFVLFISACASSGKPTAKTSDSLSNTIQTSFSSDSNTSDSDTAYAPPTGRMDGVEFAIDQTLRNRSKHKNDDFPELQSAFDSPSGRNWRPSRHYSIPNTMNEQVEKWITIFNGPLRNRFEKWITRASYVAPVLEQILDKENAPQDLIYLSMIESGFNMNAYSHAHAAGLWQFIPGTGRMYGLQSSGFVDERRDILKATSAAARHLNDLYKLYGDWYLAFAAYNAGPGTVNKAIARTGTRNFWKMAEPKSRVFRQETKDYVPRILAAAHIVKNYRKYGYDSRLFESPLTFDQVKVASSTSIEDIATCAQASLEEIQFLNPSLVFGVTPPGQSTMVFIPEGRSSSFEKKYAKLDRSKSPKTYSITHTVARKETLARVAAKYHVSAVKLAKANNLNPRRPLIAGTMLVIPRGHRMLKPVNDRPKSIGTPTEIDTLFAANETEPKADNINNIAEVIAPQPEVNPEAVNTIESENKNTVTDGQVAASETPVVGADTLAVVTPPVTTAPIAPLTYKVRRGETLASIAAKNKVQISQLRSWNRLGAKSKIYAGQTLRLSTPQETVSTPNAQPQVAAKSPTIVHKVRSGETLWDISKKYQVTITQLKNWNNLRSNQLVPNQRIRISMNNSKNVAVLR